MNWPQILASGLVAAVAAALVNGITAWLRLRAEAKDRKSTSQTEHLRAAVVDALAAEARRFRHDREARDAIDDLISGRHAGHLSEVPAHESRRQERMRLRAEADADLENALGRVRLYSSALYEKAAPLHAVKYRSALKEDQDGMTEKQRMDALAAFLKASQAQLGVRDR
ncbi:hypothetical protein [Promicromonospora sp. NPDC090134]|uniref:hypothetical protein n=1 Tax=Promicromonospora sp. NPDC090134 TaxID=3364408 RepID=UPI00381503F5